LIRIRQNGSAEEGSVSGRSGNEDANAEHVNVEHVNVEPGEILARTAEFVPTGFDAWGAESFPANADSQTGVDWQTAIKRAIRSASQLRQILGLPQIDSQKTGDGQTEGEMNFPTFVPWEFLSRIRPGDPADPLLRQVLSDPEEDVERTGFTPDPVGDLNALATGGLLHKYQGRALIIASGACGVHCRYCFRREFPYAAAGSRAEDWRPSIEYIWHRPEIEEVILSGGDPLTIVDQKLDELITAIESIPHVRRLRIHTRMPIVIPQRVTPALTARLASSRLAIWFVVHANHPNELDENVLNRLAMLIDSGVPVLNQAVLLRGVNDDAATLLELCRRLVDHRIQPYYLHQLDRVRGAAHFEVPVATGKRLMKILQESLPGYAVPTYVVEEAGKTSKTPVTDQIE
jgi:EF-P beta-lysylation protein EpmB